MSKGGGGMYMELKGMDDAQKQLEKIERGTKSIAKYQGKVYSRLPYAYGAEHGRHRKSGKVARKSGGTHYMRRAHEEVLQGMDRDIAEGLTKVTAPGKWVISRLSGWHRRLARQHAPRKQRGVKKSHNYRLYKSIRYKVRKK
jgi:hypothetical protein